MRLKWDTYIKCDDRRTAIRPELAKFAVEMGMVLRENDHKCGWDEMSVHQLFHRIKDEFEELNEACQIYIHQRTCRISDIEKISTINNIRKEAIDVANFCMFLCHNYPNAEEDKNE